MDSFFKEAIGSFKTSGTFKPSSRHLIRNCLKDINFSTAKTILEFGTGDGCFTREISRKMSPQTTLFSFEVNPTFYSYATKKFQSHTNVNILDHSALEFDQVLRAHAVQQVDYVISSLPLSLFKKSDTKILLYKVCRYLKKGGHFIQYQYSLSNYLQLRRAFNVIDIDLTLRNLPPAFVYTCSNKMEDRK